MTGDRTPMHVDPGLLLQWTVIVRVSRQNNGTLLTAVHKYDEDYFVLHMNCQKDADESGGVLADS